MMKAITAILAFVAGASVARAQWKPNNMAVFGSASGQFFISARSYNISAHSLDLARGPNVITLEPALLAVSCDRVKQELLRELNAPDQWRGKIFVVLHPAQTAADPVFVLPERFGSIWDCRVDLPDALDRDQFMEALVRACLLEMANRNALDRSSEIPEWLVRGFTRQLLGASAIKLVLPPPIKQKDGFNITRMTVDFTDAPHKPGSQVHNLNPLAEASQILRTNTPLNFDQLSWPASGQVAGDGVDIFGASAQLFVSDLMNLRNGPACMRAMLAEMPGYLNWQLAFLDAFHANFQEPLDVEKWWALELAEFSDRDLMHLLTRDESCRQLDALFQFPIEVQIGPEPPMRTDITFQTIIRGWSRAQQLPVLKKKLWELALLRLRAAPDFIPLVDDYRQVLQEYYRKRLDLIKQAPLSDKIVKNTIDRLDALDAQRAKMRPQRPGPITTASEP